MERIARLAAGALVLGAMAFSAPIAPAAAQDAIVRRTGTLPAIAPALGSETLAGAFILDPTTRRGYQVRWVRPDGRSHLEVWNLDTLKLTHTILLDREIAAAGALQVDPIVAVDEKNGRIFFAYYRDRGTQALAGVLVLDEKTGKVTDQQVSVALFAAGLKIAGMSYSAMDDRLYFFVREFTPGDPEYVVNGTLLSGLGTQRLLIVRWDPNLGREDVIRPLRSCRSLYPTENPSAHYMLPVFRSVFEPSVWLGCSNQQGGFIVVRVAWDQLADPLGVEDVYPGPEKVRDALFDPGSDRLIARYTGVTGESWWVFDGFKRSWVGVIGGSRQGNRFDQAAGLDTTTGRLYIQYPGTGLMIADTRRTPVPQALVFPEFEVRGLNQTCGCVQRIVADPVKRRFFLHSAWDFPRQNLREAQADVENLERNRWDVFQDVPPAPAPPPEDPDANTTDVSEAEGKTDVSFAAVAAGYGARTLLVGGAFGVVPPGPGAEDSRPLRAFLNRTGTQCGPRNREIALGVVEHAEVGNSLASARALPLKADEATLQDLLAPSRCDIHPDPGFPVPSGLYPGMPKPVADELDRRSKEYVAPESRFAAQECSGDQGEKKARGQEPTSGMGVVIACEQSKFESRAEAGGPAIDTGTVKVATAFSQAKLFRDPRRGLVSQVYALARGVNIADRLTIEAVETWAESSANGRAKNAARADTAATRFIRRIVGMTVRNPDGTIAFMCEDCSRDLIPTIRQANTALVGRAEVRLPMPDPVLIAGTPGGYQAAVQKDRFQKEADNALNNDSSTQVAGLEIVALNDSPELRARQVIQLAGVAASASYGIFELNEGLGGFDTPVLPDAGPLPPGAEVLATALEGTTVSESLTSPPPDLEPSSPAEVVKGLASAATLLFRKPREGALAMLVWLTIALPIYAFHRRRALLTSLASGRPK